MNRKIFKDKIQNSIDKLKTECYYNLTKTLTKSFNTIISDEKGNKEN